MSKRLQRGDGSRCPFAVSLCIYSVFAHPQALCFYSETSFEPPNEHLAAEVCDVCSSVVFSMFSHGSVELLNPPNSARVVAVRKYSVLSIKLALEAQNEHLAAEVCEVCSPFVFLCFCAAGPHWAPPKKCESGDSSKIVCFVGQTCS